jgi:hypothetical protein
MAGEPVGFAELRLSDDGLEVTGTLDDDGELEKAAQGVYSGVEVDADLNVRLVDRIGVPALGFSLCESGVLRKFVAFRGANMNDLIGGNSACTIELIKATHAGKPPKHVGLRAFAKAVAEVAAESIIDELCEKTQPTEQVGCDADVARVFKTLYTAGPRVIVEVPRAARRRQ